jgi:hypothetical protein
MRTLLVLLLLLLGIQIGTAPVTQGCDQISRAGACSDSCRDEQEPDADGQCGSCACCRVNEPLSPLVFYVPLSLPTFPVAVLSEDAGPAPCLAEIFRPPRTA